MKFCDTDENASLADLFEALEKLKGKVIESYTVHQATLEQIFLDLTRSQRYKIKIKKSN